MMPKSGVMIITIIVSTVNTDTTIVWITVVTVECFFFRPNVGFPVWTIQLGFCSFADISTGQIHGYLLLLLLL